MLEVGPALHDGVCDPLRRVPAAAMMAMPRARSRPQMKRFQDTGMTQEQAEKLTMHFTQLLCQDRDKLADLYVTKEVLKRVRRLRDQTEAIMRRILGVCLI